MVEDNYKINTHHNDFKLYYYEVEFSSDDKSTASVDNEGNITVNATGGTVIYVRLND